MTKQTALFATLLLLVNVGLAATITVKQDITLPEFDQNSQDYWNYFIFTQDQPGVVSDEVLSPGCEVHLYSKKQVFPKGKYSVTSDEKSSPSVWDGRWYRRIELQWADGEASLVCKTSDGFLLNPISNGYINDVATGYLEIK